MSSKASKWLLYGIGAVGLVVVAAVGWSFRKKDSAENTVNAVPPKRGEMIQRVTMSGTISAKRKSLVFAPYKGFVAKLFVGLGSEVNPGDPLVVVNETTSQAKDQYPLRAAIKGTVVQLEKNLGEPVRGDTDAREFIMRIDDLSTLHVQALTTELDRVKIRSGMETTIRVVALPSKTFSGRITTIDLAAKEGDPNNPWSAKSRVEFQVKASIENPGTEIRPGMGVMMDVITEKKANTLMVAHPYILRKNGKFFVTKSDGKQAEVHIGLQNEDDVEILDGVGEKEAHLMPSLDVRKG